MPVTLCYLLYSSKTTNPKFGIGGLTLFVGFLKIDTYALLRLYTLY